MNVTSRRNAVTDAVGSTAANDVDLDPIFAAIEAHRKAEGWNLGCLGRATHRASAVIFGRLFRKNCLTGLTDAYELLVGIICNSLGQRERHSAIASTRRFELGKRSYITAGFEASVEIIARRVVCFFRVMSNAPRCSRRLNNWCQKPPLAALSSGEGVFSSLASVIGVQCSRSPRAPYITTHS